GSGRCTGCDLDRHGSVHRQAARERHGAVGRERRRAGAADRREAGRDAVGRAAVVRARRVHVAGA
ncbi:hypothetical protein OY671_011957, partial [Metschnikowia pulcherrima]